MRAKLIVLSILLLLSTIPNLAMAAGEGMHFFDCKECHLTGLNLFELDTKNVCLKCHNTVADDTTPLNEGNPHGLPYNTAIKSDGRFSSADASDIYNTAVGGIENSHNWSASPTNPAAGATNPSRTLHPTMSGYRGRNIASLNCGRCHAPHGAYDVVGNPSLLVASDDRTTTMATDDLCQACHTDFSGGNSVPENRGLLTHPLLNSTQLQAVLVDENKAPNYTDLYNSLSNYDKAAPYANDVQLINDGVSCMSCHGLHFTDSDSSTPDGPYNVGSLTPGDGLLLRSDGPTSTGVDRNETAQLRSNLCQSCHTYKLHGASDSTNRIGCLDCHGGHSYNNNAPSSFVLADVSPTPVPTYNVVVSTALSRIYDIVKQVDYPVLLDATSTRVSWSNSTPGSTDGFCEKCHGDVQDDGPDGGVGKLHAQHLISGNDECSNCHNHDNPSASFDLDESAATCGDCHGFPPFVDAAGNRNGTGTDGGYAYNDQDDPFTWNYVDDTDYEKNEANTAHKTHSGGQLTQNDVPVEGRDRWYTFNETEVDNCKICHGPKGGQADGGHRQDPGLFPNTFRDVPINSFAGIANAYNAIGTTVYNPDGTCSNVYCHSAGGPRDGGGGRDFSAGLQTTVAWEGIQDGSAGYNSITVSGTRCSTCHGNDTGTMTAKNNTWEVHDAHFNSASIGTNCSICHLNSAADWQTLSSNAKDHTAGSDGDHVNGIVDVVYNTTLYNGALLGETYDANGDGTCSVYCHDTPDTSGKNRTADWDVAGAMTCNSCHDDQLTPSTSTDSHRRHSVDANGPRLFCAECHGAGSDDGTHSGHMDGKKTYITLSGSDLTAWGTEYPQNFCDKCHGFDSQQGEVQPLWFDLDSEDCATCHAGYDCGGDFTNPSGDNIMEGHLTEARKGGHNRPAIGYNSAVNYPQTDNPPAKAECTTCHLADSPYHWNGEDYNTSSDPLDLMLRIDNGFPAYSGNEDLFCLNCHGTSPAGTRNHPTHEAALARNKDIATHMIKECIACHDVHGTTNLQMIWADQTNQNDKDVEGVGEYTGRVEFTNVTDFTANSYDEDDPTPGAPPYGTEDNADDLCATCHTAAGGDASETTLHNNADNSSTGDHAGAFDRLGTDCMSGGCHVAHNDTNGNAFGVGAGTTCDQCHGYPPATGAHNLHSRVTANDLTDADRSDCAYCHTDADNYTYDKTADMATMNHSDKAGRRVILNTTIGYGIDTGDRWTCTKACHNSDDVDGYWYTWDGSTESTTPPNRLPYDTDGLACDKCHYYSDSPTRAGNVQNDRAESISSAHDEHFDAGKVCGDCHDIDGVEYNSGNPIPGGVNGLAHINYNSVGSDIIFYNGAALAEPDEAGFDEGGGVRDVLPALGYNDSNTCSNATTGCHATGAAEWYTPIDDGNAGCLQCHTDTTDTNFNPTSGLHNNTAPLPVSGNAHDGSFYNGDGSAGTADCVTCHTTSPSSAHFNGVLNSATFVTIDSGVIPTYNVTTQTCNTNCHTAGTAWAYKWSDTSYNSDGTECQNCHGTWGNFSEGMTHRGIDYATDPKPKDTHATGTFGCKDCHAIESASGYTYTASTADWDDNSPAVTGLAAETSHHGNSEITINYNGTNFGRNGSSLSGCVTCHAQYDGTAPGQFAFDTTAWTLGGPVQGEAVVSNCSQCHGGGHSGANANSYWPAGANAQDNGEKNNSGAHERHIIALAEVVFPDDIGVDDNATIQNLLTDGGNYGPLTSEDRQRELCSYCHLTPADPADAGHTDTGLPAEVNSMATLWDKTGDDGLYSNLDDTCATVDCHFNKLTPDDVYGWYDNNDGDCVMCHVDVTDGSTPSSNGGTHVAHMNSAVLGTTLNFGMTIGCDDCHGPGSVAWDTNAPTTSDGVAPTSNHLDGTFAVDGGARIDGTINVYTSGEGCGTNYCHNDGNGGAPAVDNPDYEWGVALTDCDICHAATPTVTAAHGPHLSNTTYVPNGCNDCHAAEDLITHINAIVEFDGVYVTAPANATGWDSSCTNDCHVSATGAGTDWTDTAVANCTDCHSSTYIGGDNWRSSGKNHLPQTGLHDVVPKVSEIQHDDSFLYNSGALTGECITCHTSTPSSGHMNNSFGMTYNSATNSEINFATDVSYGDALKPTCSPNGSLASCHFDGGDWSRIWHENSADPLYNAAGGSQLPCAGCHGYWQAGSDGSGWRAGTSHAEDPTRGSSTNHNDGQINLGFDCYACHVLGGTNIGDYPWTNVTNDWKPNEAGLTLHGDNAININNTAVLSVQHNVNGRSGCTGCHNGAEDPGPTIHDYPTSLFSLNEIASTDQVAAAGGCSGCHGDGGDNFYPDGDTAGAVQPTADDEPGMHKEHVDALVAKGMTQTDSCAMCHGPEPGTNSTWHNKGDQVADLPKDQSFNYNSIGRFIKGYAEDADGVFNWTAGDTGTSTCSNIDCHFNMTNTWHWYPSANLAPNPTLDGLSGSGGPNPCSVQLTYNSPGMDPGMVNTTAYAYDIRYSESAINTGNFASATRVGGVPPAYVRGSNTVVNVENLDHSKTYHFAIKTMDTEGQWSTTIDTVGPVAPTLDTEAPMFYGADKATVGDEGGAINLWWTEAEDHSMFDMSNLQQTPITYNIWLKPEEDGPLDLTFNGSGNWTGTGYNSPVIEGFTGSEIELEGEYWHADGGYATYNTVVTNDLNYQLAVQACDVHNNCDTNKNIVTVTPKGVPLVPQEFYSYVSNQDQASNVVTMFNSGSPGAGWAGSFSNASPMYFISNPESFPRTYYVSSFAVYIDPGNAPETITGTLGTWNGSTFTQATPLKQVVFTPGKRAARVYTLKFSDAAGEDVASDESIAIRLTAAAAVNVSWGSSAWRGDIDVAERKINLPPNPVVPTTMQLNGAIVDMVWPTPAPDTDGIPVSAPEGEAQDPIHFDIYGSNTGAAPYNYVIAEELDGTETSIEWNTQMDGITGGDIAVLIRTGDGYDHAIYESGVLGTATPFDQVRPAKITDLAALPRPKGGTYELRWTSPGDDEWNNGRATSFEIRYSPTGSPGISDGASFNSATLVGDPANLEMGPPPYPDFGYHVMNLELTGLQPSLAYDFAIKAVDEQGLKGDLSNIATGAVSGPRCGMCHNTGPTVVESAGNHKLHDFTLSDCAKCHGNVTQTYGLDHQDGELTMGYGSSGPVVGTIVDQGAYNSIVYYNGGIQNQANIMYEDTSGFGGFGEGDYTQQGDGIDNGSCFNFGSMGVGGCHGPAGSDPDGTSGESEYPLFETPDWTSTANLDCGRCHGNPNREETSTGYFGGTYMKDAYGRDYDATSANGGVVPDQIIGSPGADNRGGWDRTDGDINKRKYIGHHEKHLNYSFRFSKGDNCALCHYGHYDDINDLDGKHGDGNIDVQIDTTAAGAKAHYNAAGPGAAGTCFDMDPFNCHPSDAEPLWDYNDNFACIGCHTMGGAGNIANIGHLSDESQGITRDYDSGNGYEGNPGNCTWCHFAGHPTDYVNGDEVTGEALILPNNPQVGINYKSGGIHLRKQPGDGAGSANVYESQAELCWGCHEDQTPKISEWGPDEGNPNTETNPIVNPSVDYDYGSVSTPLWNTAIWTSPNFSYKSGAIQSTHSTNQENGHSNVTWNSGVGVGQYEESPDRNEDIQCHNCHDVHNMNFADGDTANGNPYLRGSWKRNPYREDGAPRSGQVDYSVGGANRFGEVPRGGTQYFEMGGYQIDQNNETGGLPPTKGLSLGNSAGICTLCHGEIVDTMDVAANGNEGLWLGTNGHSNSSLGGTANDAISVDIFNFNTNAYGRTPAGAPTAYTGDYGPGGTGRAGQPSTAYLNASQADGAESHRGDGFRSAYGSKGFSMTPFGTSDYYFYVDYNWGVYEDQGLVKGYHSFTCSKCHNPHASRLPKLLITNCLDTKQNTWDNDNLATGTNYQGDDSPSADNINQPKSNLTSAQNCHRLGDPTTNGGSGGTGGGWNNVTPRGVTLP